MVSITLISGTDFPICRRVGGQPRRHDDIIDIRKGTLSLSSSHVTFSSQSVERSCKVATSCRFLCMVDSVRLQLGQDL